VSESNRIIKKKEFLWGKQEVCTTFGSENEKRVDHNEETHVNTRLVLQHRKCGVRGGAVGLGTAVQAGRSRVRFPMVSLKFFIDIILLAALWPCGRLSL
jgi:hypothetical protein